MIIFLDGHTKSLLLFIFAIAMEKNSFILMLEDDPDDRFLTETTMKDLGYETDITFVKSSKELFAALENGDRPTLILLDYNSSPDNAVEILRFIKTNSRLKSIPVIVLSDSSSPKDIHECYLQGANSFIKKPTSASDTTDKINTFFKYWLTVAAV